MKKLHAFGTRGRIPSAEAMPADAARVESNDRASNIGFAIKIVVPVWIFVTLLVIFWPF